MQMNMKTIDNQSSIELCNRLEDRLVAFAHGNRRPPTWRESDDIFFKTIGDSGLMGFMTADSLEELCNRQKSVMKTLRKTSHR